MNSLTKQEVNFIITLNASEESMLIHLKQELEYWNCDSDLVLRVITNLIEEDFILLSQLGVNRSDDFSKTGSLEIISNWKNLETTGIILYLTEEGSKYWNSNDWKISSERAKYLMFSSDSRIPND